MNLLPSEGFAFWYEWPIAFTVGSCAIDLLLRHRVGARRFLVTWALAACFELWLGAFTHRSGRDMTGAAVSELTAATLFFFWSWWNRRGKRIAKLLGAKAKAKRDALVRKLRQLKPRPVLQPAPA